MHLHLVSIRLTRRGVLEEYPYLPLDFASNRILPHFSARLYQLCEPEVPERHFARFVPVFMSFRYRPISSFRSELLFRRNYCSAGTTVPLESHEIASDRRLRT